MEKKIRNLFLLGTLLLAGSATLLATATHATTVEGDNAMNGLSAQTTYQVVVPNTLTLQSVNGVTMTASSLTTVNTSNTLSATVLSNAGYSITMKAATPALTNGSNNIPASSSVTGGTRGWGIKKSGASGYTAISTTDQTFYTGTYTGATARTTNFEVGVGIDKSLPAGTYSTTVTITATQP